MRIVKLVLKKKNTSWKTHCLSLDKTHTETKSFDLDALDVQTKRSILRAQDNFGVLEIIDLDDPCPNQVIPPPYREPVKIETRVIESPKEPKVGSLEPSFEDTEIAMGIRGKRISYIKNVIKSHPKTAQTKRIILALLKLEKGQSKPRKTLVSFLEEAFLAIPEGEQ